MLDTAGNWQGPWLGGVQKDDAVEPDQGWTNDPWGYTNWAPGEPNDYPPGQDGDEQCLQFFWQPPDGPDPVWNDVVWNSPFVKA
jgi:hypothetical protein